MVTLSPVRPPAEERPPAQAGSRPVPRWQGPQARTAAVDDLATACLALVTIAAALGFVRLFSGLAFAPYVVAAAALGHGSAWALRRLGVGLTGASIAAGVGSALLAVWLVSPQDTTYGFVTPSTIERTGADLAAAREVFRNVVAPVAPVPGFLLAVTLAVALVAFLADWAAFRMRATFEAVVPAFALFIVTAIFGTPVHRTATVAGLAAASLLFLIVQRAALDSEQATWFGGRSAGALPSLLTAGALLGATALVGGLVVGPRIPGATSKALVQLRGEGGGGNGGTRSTISPLVDIRGRLVNPTDAEVFQVRADRPSYWRLTSLDTFDGNIWSSNEKYRQTKGTLAPDVDLVGVPLVQEVTISSLSSIWLPAAYRPQKVSGAKGVSYSERSASLISKQSTSDGLVYELTSVVSSLSPALLRSEPASTPGASGLGADFENLTAKPRVSRPVLALVNRLTANQRTSYDKAKAIQDHLRTFTYDLSVGAGHGTDALTSFLLTSKRGYCEQFAGAFAVLARLIGLPSRVAVGFQPGRTEADRTFQVRNKDAHAWPEVYFEGVGWVAFEPTPADGTGSDGNPDAAGYTGIPYTPAPASGPDPAQPTGAGANGETPDGGATTSTTTPKDEVETAVDDTLQQSSGPALRIFLGLVGILVLGGGVVAACWAVAEGRRKRRRAAADTPARRIALAWDEAEEALRLTGVTRRSTMTVDEWLSRLNRPSGGAAGAGVERGSKANAALRRLGDAVVSAAYGGPAVPAEAATAARADSAAVVAAAHDAAGTWTVALWTLDPRPALAAWRSERTGRRVVGPLAS